jgi:hypothetical protein
MADFTYANWETIEALFVSKSRGIKTAVTAALAKTAAINTALDAIPDDTGVCALLRAASQKADNALDGLEQAAYQSYADALQAVFQDYDTTPKDGSDVPVALTLDAWFTASKASMTNPLMCNDTVLALRRAGGTVSAVNAACLVNTLYGTFTITGATAGTLVAVSAPVDSALYKGAPLKVVVTTQVEGADANPVTGIITGLDANGTAWTGTYSIPDASAAATEIAVTPSVAKTYPVSISAVTVANAATTYGAFTIKAADPRTIS